ncbi:MAG: rhomboid family intramembrane serine protease, partial [Halalkalicoccus sp.]|nr:rhomboid family intramembrane serine protease [Halalkalicoccus sp.]
MAQCDRCGAHENLPYRCGRCGGVYCASHRLPENHDCPGLQEWQDPDGIFDSGFDDSVDNPGGGERTVRDRVPINTGTGGPLGYFRNNMTYVFLLLMWVTFSLQFLLLPLLGFGPTSTLSTYLFVLQSNDITHVWTWITSIFAHGSVGHIVMNSIVLYFFGPIVERKVGSRNFTILFLASGVLAGLAQVGASLALGEFSAVVGASGAIAGVLGAYFLLYPRARILAVV